MDDRKRMDPRRRCFQCSNTVPIERRTCKHLRKYRGETAEFERVGSALPAPKAAKAHESNEPALLLAQTWTNDIDLAGWWMSEKLDGIRGYWNGREPVSRSGHGFATPPGFTANFPAVPLDGALWSGRQ